MIATTANLVHLQQPDVISRFFAARSGVERVDFSILDALLPLQSQQAMSDHKEIRQSTCYEEPIGILGDATVAHLGECEHAFDDADGMLDAGPRTGSCD